MEAPLAGAGVGTVRRWLQGLEARVPFDSKLRAKLFADMHHFLTITRILEDTRIVPAAEEPRKRPKRGSTAPKERKTPKGLASPNSKKTTRKMKESKRGRSDKNDDNEEEDEGDEDNDGGTWNNADISAIRGRAAELVVEWTERYAMEAPSLRIAATRAAPLAARPRNEVIEAHWRRVESEARSRSGDIDECLQSLQRCFDLLGLNDFAPSAAAGASHTKAPGGAAPEKEKTSADDVKQRHRSGNEELGDEGEGGAVDDVIASAGLGSGAWNLEVSVSLSALRNVDTAPVFEELSARAAQLGTFSELLMQWIDVAKTAFSVHRTGESTYAPLIAKWERLLASVQMARNKCAELGALRHRPSTATDVAWE